MLNSLVGILLANVEFGKMSDFGANPLESHPGLLAAGAMLALTALGGAALGRRSAGRAGTKTSDGEGVRSPPPRSVGGPRRRVAMLGAVGRGHPDPDDSSI